MDRRGCVVVLPLGAENARLLGRALLLTLSAKGLAAKGSWSCLADNSCQAPDCSAVWDALSWSYRVEK